jgi:tetratricopeptide (TPR) repeat protein
LTWTGGDARLWEVGTWREVRRLKGAGTFSPDSRLLALQDGSSEIRLEETATGREVARLTGPEQGWYLPDLFTPDGTRLITRSGGFHQVWNLRLIRRQLKELGLDWDWPEFPPAAPGSESPPALQVEALAGDLGKPDKPLWTPEQRARQAIESYRRRLDANPNDAAACNNLAWAYLTAPGPLRDVKAAVPLAEKAVRLGPASATYANTLGVAYYRAGRYREAADTFRSNLARQEDSALAFDLYFLAMSYHKLGETARARDCYDWAVRWSRTQQGLTADQREELTEFRAEARELLKIKEQ